MLLLLALLPVACSPLGIGGWTPLDSAEEPPVDDSTDGTPADSEEEDDPEDVGGWKEKPEEFDIDIEPHGACFVDEIEVELDVNQDAEIWYAFDDERPTPGESLFYEKPFTLDSSRIVRAVAVNGDGQEIWDAAVFTRLKSEVAERDSNIPLMVLYSEFEVPDSKDDGYIPFGVLTFDPEDGDDGRAKLASEAGLTKRCSLKVRGSSTAGYAKKSYSLEIQEDDENEDDDVALLGLPEESDWVLLAPLVFDRALMRNALAYRLSNDIGCYAPRTRFLELYAVGEGQDLGLEHYLGVYVLEERIKVGENRVDIAELTAEDVAEPEVTGGYMFKRDRVGDGESGFWAGTADGRWSFNQYLVYVEPDEDEIVPAQSAYLSAALDAFGWALAMPDGIDPGTGAHWTDLVDVDGWIDHHLINAYTMNPDAFRLSGYLYKDREGPIVAGPIWDFDRTMGCDSDSRCYYTTWWDVTRLTSDTTDLFDHGWYSGLFDRSEFTEPYWDRWREVIEGPLSTESVHAIIDEWAEELSESAVRNFDRWPSYPPDGGSFEYEVQELKVWTELRTAWIEGCLQLEDPEHCTGN